MRALIVLYLLVTPASAWEFTAAPVCTITHETPDLALRITFDPAQSQPYSIALTRPAAWEQTESFGLRFDGPAAMTIGTGRHQLSADGQTLTVTDTGFDNVLDGLAYNAFATALAGATEVRLDLTGARPAVEAFRACDVLPSA